MVGILAFHLSFMLTGYPKNSRRARLFSFFNQSSGENRVRDGDEFAVETKKHFLMFLEW